MFYPDLEKTGRIKKTGIADSGQFDYNRFFFVGFCTIATIQKLSESDLIICFFESGASDSPVYPFQNQQRCF